MPNELADIQKKLKTLSEELEKTVDVDAIEYIAEQASEVFVTHKEMREDSSFVTNRSNRPVIAVAKDEAFCFYYEDNFCYKKIWIKFEKSDLR